MNQSRGEGFCVIAFCQEPSHALELCESHHKQLEVVDVADIWPNLDDDSLENQFDVTPSELSPDGCWIWHGMTDKRGRPVVRFHSEREPYLATKYSLEREGTIFEIDDRVHSECGNIRCINPDHLSLMKVKKTWPFPADPDEEYAIWSLVVGEVYAGAARFDLLDSLERLSLPKCLQERFDFLKSGASIRHYAESKPILLANSKYHTFKMDRLSEMDERELDQFGYPIELPSKFSGATLRIGMHSAHAYTMQIVFHIRRGVRRSMDLLISDDEIPADMSIKEHMNYTRNRFQSLREMHEAIHDSAIKWVRENLPGALSSHYADGGLPTLEVWTSKKNDILRVGATPRMNPKAHEAFIRIDEGTSSFAIGDSGVSVGFNIERRLMVWAICNEQPTYRERPGGRVHEDQLHQDFEKFLFVLLLLSYGEKLNHASSELSRVSGRDSDSIQQVLRDNVGQSLTYDSRNFCLLIARKEQHSLTDTPDYYRSYPLSILQDYEEVLESREEVHSRTQELYQMLNASISIEEQRNATVIQKDAFRWATIISLAALVASIASLVVAVVQLVAQ